MQMKLATDTAMMCLPQIKNCKMYTTLMVSGIDPVDWFVFSLLLKYTDEENTPGINE